MPSDKPSSSLYGAPRPKSKPKSTLPTSTSLTFASQLNSLLSAPTTSTRPARPRSLAKPHKDDIFSGHHSHKGAKKRVADDGSDDENSNPATATKPQKHQTDIGAVDSRTLHRSKRKMEEKARLYAAMKRGDYVPPSSQHGRGGGLGDERAPLVDFDRKWAEAEGGKEGSDADTSSDDGGGDYDDDHDHDGAGEETVEYTDEFGRTRRGTRAEVAREQRRQRIATNAAAELAELRARPGRDGEGSGAGANLIVGDTVQAAAFNPDENIAVQMAELAARRDRSMTPPEDLHYDASKEIRSKGVGFYQFSRDKEGREAEMAALVKERAETEKRAKEREKRREERAKELEERWKVIREKRGKRQADDFLRRLDIDPGVGADEGSKVEEGESKTS